MELKLNDSSNTEDQEIVNQLNLIMKSPKFNKRIREELTPDWALEEYLKIIDCGELRGDE